MPEASAALSRALAAIRHRGPDGEGEWFGGARGGEQVALGHCRLAIIDLSDASAQPFTSHDGRLTLAYNGELYNYLELRDELIAHGHRFTTLGDTEVVVEAYRRWGADAFPRFRGMFALALWDCEDQSLVLARDQMGKKPLYLSPIDGGFAFASEIEAIRRIPGVDSTLDLGQIPGYLARRYVDGPATFFAGIRKLPPGTLLIHKDGVSRERQYYRTPLLTVKPVQRPLAENVGRLEAVLDEAVRLRMRSDAPYGLYLSGGLDSSTLLALMNRHSPRPVRTFSVGFAGDCASELGAAAQTARDFGADHSELPINAADFADAWPTCVRLRGEPVSQATDVAIYLLSKKAGESVKMVLTGEGADELLAGYPKYWGERYLTHYHAVVRPGFHRALVHPLLRRLPSRFHRLKTFSRAASTRDPGDRARVWFSSDDDDLIARLALAWGTAPVGAFPAGVGTVRRLQLDDFAHWLPDNLLERGDRMMMGGSIEGRMPFMDTELARLAAEFPENHLVRGRRPKLVLHELAKRLIREELLRRPKIGFAVPLDTWFRGELRSMLADLLISDDSRVRALVDGAALKQIYARHMDGRENNSKVLWSVANLELFLRQYG